MLLLSDRHRSNIAARSTPQNAGHIPYKFAVVAQPASAQTPSAALPSSRRNNPASRTSFGSTPSGETTCRNVGKHIALVQAPLLDWNTTTNNTAASAVLGLLSTVPHTTDMATADVAQSATPLVLPPFAPPYVDHPPLADSALSNTSTAAHDCFVDSPPRRRTHRSRPLPLPRHRRVLSPVTWPAEADQIRLLLASRLPPTPWPPRANAARSPGLAATPRSSAPSYRRPSPT